MPDPVLLEVNNLGLAFGEGRARTQAVSGVDLVIHQGEVVALVGESGSGKTVTALSMARLVPTPPAVYTSGSIRFEGREILTMAPRELNRLRGGRIAYVFQEPGSALNPVFRAGYQISEALVRHGFKGRTDDEVHALLNAVGIDEPDRVAASYPHEISGGQQQRVMLAMALACRPDLLIADEPTTALDVTVQAQILKLLRDLQQRYGMAVLLITHNLAVAASLAQRIYVMYAGHVVEHGSAGEMIRTSRHPYTRALLAAVPRLRGGTGVLEGIPGQIPGGTNWPEGCRFHPRCRMARPACEVDPVDMQSVSPDHASRCLFWPEVGS